MPLIRQGHLKQVAGMLHCSSQTPGNGLPLWQGGSLSAREELLVGGCTQALLD